MEDIWSVEFAVIGGFPLANLFGQIDVFFLRTIKNKTPCFWTNKNAVRVVL